MSTNPQALLEARKIVKHFPGLLALYEVDFTVNAGEIHALLGENGAGKSTLIKGLTGAQEFDSGSVWLNGSEIRPSSPADAVRLGVSTVYQELNLAPNLSVAENICLGREPTGRFGISWKSVRTRASEALRRINADVDLRQPLGSCSTAIQQLVAIARALDVSAKVLILDEPTSSLDRHEVEQLFAVMRSLKDDGLGIIFVTHFLDQVYAVCDRITVLRNGKKVIEEVPQKLDRLQLVGAMTGRDPTTLEMSPAAKGGPSTGPVLLSAANLGRARSVQGLDLEVRAGEVIGFAGLLGSGRTETIRLLYGIDKPTEGQLSLGKHPSVLVAIRNGLGLCPEDRKAQGILPQLSVAENILVALQAKRGWFRPIPKKQRETLVNSMIAQLRVATPDPSKAIEELSGGNQQKALLARWLIADPKLLLLDEPTRGIDVGAKFEIMSEVERLRKQGMAFVFVSSEIPEVVRAANPVIVFRDRRVAAKLAGGDITESKVAGVVAGED